MTMYMFGVYLERPEAILLLTVTFEPWLPGMVRRSPLDLPYTNMGYPTCKIAYRLDVVADSH